MPCISKCLLIILLFSGFIFSQENYEVTGIAFEGNETLDDEKISEAITFTSTGWFSKNILREEPFLFNSAVLSTDLTNIVKLYQREGFLSVKVSEGQLINDEDKTVEVVFKIIEGAPVIVDSVNIQQIKMPGEQNADTDSLISAAYRDLNLTKGKRFRDEDIRTDETYIISCYLNNGYPHVKVNFELYVDTANHSVNINWYVNKGEFSAFGRTSVTGLNYYSEGLVRGKFNYNRGEIYNSEKLEETQLRLYDLGIFYNVNFISVLNSNIHGVVPVQLNLTEAKRLRTTIGAGYGKDEKFRISLELTLLGFLKGPGRINFEAKTSAIETFSFQLGYILPEFLWERTSLRLNTFTSRIDEIAYEEDSRGFNVGVVKAFSKYFYSSITYSLGHIDLDLNSIAIQDDSTQLKEKYNKSGIGFLFKVTNADPVISPEKGFTISLSPSYSGLGLESPYKFIRIVLDIRKYTLLFESMVSGIRLSAGYLKSFNTPEFIPVEERFYLGGSNSVRGWERFELGPEDINGKPIGGSSFFEGSVEFRYPSLEKLYGVAFLDFGNVWEESLVYKLNELQYAAGIGLRYNTPIGPLRLDFARPIFNENKTIQFWLNIGHTF